MSSHTIELTGAIYDYLLTSGTRESDAARELRAHTLDATPWHRMQVSPEQGSFMQVLVKLIGARRAIEVGTFTGYSALVVAEALPDDGVLIACDVSEEWTSVGRPFWDRAGVANKIELRLKPAVDTLDELIAAGESDSFDFAFIDADKANYDAYYERCLTLLRRGGVIGIDNVLWGGRVADEGVRDEDTRAAVSRRPRGCSVNWGSGLRPTTNAALAGPSRRTSGEICAPIRRPPPGHWPRTTPAFSRQLPRSARPSWPRGSSLNAGSTRSSSCTASNSLISG